MVDFQHSKLIPGQKVLIYKPTGQSIISASGKTIGKKERVLGSGEVKLNDKKMIVVSSKLAGTTPPFKNNRKKGHNRLKIQSVTKKKYNNKTLYNTTVLIKPIDD